MPEYGWSTEQDREEVRAVIACKERCGCHLIHALCRCLPSQTDARPCGFPCKCEEEMK